MKIGIIVAMSKELELLKPMLENGTEKIIGNVKEDVQKTYKKPASR